MQIWDEQQVAADQWHHEPQVEAEHAPHLRLGEEVLRVHADDDLRDRGHHEQREIRCPPPKPRP